MKFSKEVRKVLFWMPALFLFLLGLPGFSIEAGAASGKLKVYVVNYPLKYFAERIGGEYLKVVFPAPADIDPAYWNPDLQAIADYQKADLILLNGAGYAGWIEKYSLPRSKLVNTSKKFKDRYITTTGAVTHSHGPQGKHAHESIAFTTWIDFSLAAGQAQAIAKALGRKRPELRAAFQKNFAALEKDLLDLDGNIKSIVSSNPGRPLVASHPVYDYLAKRYGLNIQSVHWEPDEIPDEQQRLELQRILKQHPAKWMIWEGAPARESVEILKSLEMYSLVFDPCGNTPDNGNFLSVMQNNVKNLRKAFK